MRYLLGLTISLWMFNSHADGLITNDALYSACSTGEQKELCTTYIMGIYDGFSMGRTEAYMHNNGLKTYDKEKLPEITRLCIPTNLDNKTAIKIYRQYIERNPKYLKRFAGIAVIQSLREAFPCNL
ncbi:Rap1a/Tai family immunity protein [Kiloniella sp. EL199]|uniref:Rap1a/Tai family immunity protein n=1 Tax=Kiloniella sp. EL199 TaxID=2107581 RepID=UPI000EA1F707|nr:Rap1a/Tai family immunity protein [Kiloniella sp. EL199]